MIKLVCTPFLKNRVALAIVNKLGTIPVEKEALTIISRGAEITCLVAFKIATYLFIYLTTLLGTSTSSK